MIKKYLDEYVIAQLIILVLILFSTPFGKFDSTFLAVLGFVLFAGGAGLVYMSVKALGPALSPLVSPIEEGLLVTTGIYGKMRHPMYSAVILIVLGWSLFWGSFVSLIFSLILAGFFIIKTEKEERLLSLKFPDYLAYQTQVPFKFIPAVY